MLGFLIQRMQHSWRSGSELVGLINRARFPFGIPENGCFASHPSVTRLSVYAENKTKGKGSFDAKKEVPTADGATHIAAQTFTFRELAAATKNFRPECLLGEGGFGRVYKGRLENTGQASTYEASF